MEFTDREWANLLAKDCSPSKERVIFTTKFRKTLRIRKDAWSRFFPDFGGVDLVPGPEIELVRADEGGAKVAFPTWAIDRLALGSQDVVCITRRGDRLYLKKLEITEMPTRIPGCTVIDVFGDGIVERTYGNRPDLDGIHLADLEGLLASMGRFRYDPLAPFRQMDGQLGLLARKTFLGGFTSEDREAARVYRQQIADGQQENGSWEDNVLQTASNLIQLLELDVTPTDPTIERAARWLLSLPEPAGLPGLFMVSEQLAERFNRWKTKPGAKGRPHRRESKGELQSFLDNVGYVTNCAIDACELRLTWTSAIVLESLLRCGLHDDPRVVKALNTLFGLNGSGNWCGCGYLDARVNVLASAEPIDLNRMPVPQQNEAYAIDWFPAHENIRDLVCNHRYRAFETGNRETLLVKFAPNTGLCKLVVNRALSYHPGYPGSNLEATAALFRAFFQSAYGTWGDMVYLSSMFGFMARSTHPLDAFLVLRSVPLLIREQRADGFWQEKPIDCGDKMFPPPTKEESTLMILGALSQFGFLSALLPV